MQVPCWRAPLELLGTAPDVCSDCSPLDMLLGSGKETCGVYFDVACRFG